MPFKIRTKLIIAFFAVIFPFIAIVSAIAIYNTNAIRNVSLKEDAISEEMQLVLSLQLALDKSIMPGNDYIITGDRKYIDEFSNASRDVDDLIKKVEGILVRLKGMEAPKIKEETELLKSVRTTWQNIKEDSQRIFEIQNPVGNKEATRIMEEMDYKWAYPLIKLLDKHREIDRKEHAEAVEELESVWRMVWIIMIGGSVILITSGVFFALFFSRQFTRPIHAIRNGADAIAAGDFKTRLDIKTDDEFEQLANAMNEMAAQLDNLYETLEQRIEERTRELKESETHFRGIVETAKDAMICISEDGIIYLWNKSAEEMFGYSANEAIDKEIHSLIVPERFREKANDGFKTFLHTGTGPVIGKLIELIGLKKDGAEFPVDLSVSAMNIRGKRHAVGIIRDITERRKAEEELQERIENLERFRKATVQREFRIKELRDENEELKRKLGIHKV